MFYINIIYVEVFIIGYDYDLWIVVVYGDDVVEWFGGGVCVVLVDGGGFGDFDVGEVVEWFLYFCDGLGEVGVYYVGDVMVYDLRGMVEYIVEGVILLLVVRVGWVVGSVVVVIVCC